MKYVPFNKPAMTGHEFSHVEEAIRNAHLSGNGPFSKRCNRWLEDVIGTRRALLTSSCTAALEMSALLLELEPGDEVIMPSFTFVSTAAAVALRRAVPVFVDVREDTLNLDESRVEAACTARTRAVVVVHYAGVAREMNPIVRTRGGPRYRGRRRTPPKGSMPRYRGRPLGSIGCLAALSFHETKNVTCGEGGAILVNDERFIEKAEIIYEKGTNRAQFFRGHVDKYTWVELGSSFPLSDLNAAFLWGQLQESETLHASACRCGTAITTHLRIWRHAARCGVLSFRTIAYITRISTTCCSIRARRGLPLSSKPRRRESRSFSLLCRYISRRQGVDSGVHRDRSTSLPRLRSGFATAAVGRHGPDDVERVVTVVTPVFAEPVTSSGTDRPSPWEERALPFGPETRRDLRKSCGNKAARIVGASPIAEVAYEVLTHDTPYNVAAFSVDEAFIDRA